MALLPRHEHALKAILHPYKIADTPVLDKVEQSLQAAGDTAKRLFGVASESAKGLFSKAKAEVDRARAARGRGGPGWTNVGGASEVPTSAEEPPLSK